jgi:hypothetical protein
VTRPDPEGAGAGGDTTVYDAAHGRRGIVAQPGSFPSSKGLDPSGRSCGSAFERTRRLHVSSSTRDGFAAPTNLLPVSTAACPGLASSPGLILLMPRHRAILRAENGNHSAGGRTRDVAAASPFSLEELVRLDGVT